MLQAARASTCLGSTPDHHRIAPQQRPPPGSPSWTKKGELSPPLPPISQPPYPSRPYLQLSPINSHLVCILDPGKSIAGGGYCDIFLGMHTPTRLRLALKRPRFCLKGTVEADEARRRFEREAHIWISLVHSNVLPFYGLLEISNDIYLASPWMDFGDLSKFTTARLHYLNLPAVEQLRATDAQRLAYSTFKEFDVIHGIAVGLAYLHSKGVVHGDLKAANVLLDDLLNPMLGDFGMTKVLGGEYSVTSPGLRGKGSSRWMSPGLVDSSPKTAKSDIYAFSMIIVEVLTGKIPFPNLGSSGSVFRAICCGRRPPFEPLSREGQNFEGLWNLAASCWDVDPDKRPNARDIVTSMGLFISPVSGYGPVGTEVQDKQGGSIATETTSYSTSSLAVVVPPPHPVTHLDISLIDQDSGIRTAMPNMRVADLERRPEEGDQGDTLQHRVRKRAESLLCTGEASMRQGRYDEAASAVQQAFGAFEDLHDRSKMAECLYRLAGIHRKRERYDEARTMIQNAYLAFEALADQLGMARCRQSLGDILRKQGNYDSAQSEMLEARRTYEYLGVWSNLADCLWQLGDIYRMQGRYCDACTMLQEAGRLYQRIQHQHGLAESLRALGGVYLEQKRYQEARIALHEATGAYATLGNRLGIAESLRVIASIQQDQGSYNQARSTLEEAWREYQHLGNRVGMARCVRGIGEAHQAQGNYEEARLELQDAVRLCEEFNHRLGKAQCLRSLGEVLSIQGDAEGACAKLDQSSRIYEELGIRHGVADCLQSFGEVYRTQGRCDAARAVVSKAHEIFRELGVEAQVTRCSTFLEGLARDVAENSSG
ncbi:hypothetical protein FRB93_013700 [Tulasnella sp. JGI-2019a]|nr:hypothetical protein FRB93_013700 [Tulasnella sp. JGI-2019a]